MELALREEDLRKGGHVSSVRGRAVRKLALGCCLDGAKVDSFQRLGAQGSELGCVRDGLSSSICRFSQCRLVGVCQVEVELEGRRLDDALGKGERAFPAVGCDVVEDAGRTRTLTNSSDTSCVSSEATDILLDPFEGDALVVETEIRGNTASAKPAEQAKTIVDRYNNDTLFAVELRARDNTSRASCRGLGSGGEAATVNPYQDRCYSRSVCATKEAWQRAPRQTATHLVQSCSS